MNILIADDHQIFRQSLAILLENRTEHCVVAHVDNLSELLSAVEHHQPDCILLDYHMPGGDTIKIAGALNRKFPSLRVIALTGAQSTAILRQLSELSFAALLHKRDSAEVILQAIARVEQGEFFISSSVSEMLGEVDVALTQRELQVLSHFVQGKNVANIAGDLNISARTVEKHKENMMKKLGVTNAVQLIEVGHRILLD